MKATRLLMDEHEYILRAIAVIDGMAARVADGEMPDERDVETVHKFLRFFGDGHQQEREESVLFPALLKASHAEEYACLCQITFEHNQQRSLLDGMEDALKTHKERDFVYYAKRLGELVRAHIKSEEEQVFKRADAILSAEEDERLAQELAAYDSPYQAGRLGVLLQRLVAMEVKYVLPRTRVNQKAHCI